MTRLGCIVCLALSVTLNVVSLASLSSKVDRAKSQTLAQSQARTAAEEEGGRLKEEVASLERQLDRAEAQRNTAWADAALARAALKQVANAVLDAELARRAREIAPVREARDFPRPMPGPATVTPVRETAPPPRPVR